MQSWRRTPSRSDRLRGPDRSMGAVNDLQVAIEPCELVREVQDEWCRPSEQWSAIPCFLLHRRKDEPPGVRVLIHHVRSFPLVCIPSPKSPCRSVRLSAMRGAPRTLFLALRCHPCGVPWMQVGPDYEQPDLVTPDAWHSQPWRVKTRAGAGAWWKEFNDPTDTLIERASQQPRSADDHDPGRLRRAEYGPGSYLLLRRR